MRRLVPIFCFIFICVLGTTSAHAQSKQKPTKIKPDFSGNWLLDRAKGNVGSSTTPDQPVKIVHHDPELKITRMIASNGQVTAQDFVYYTDGRGETNPMLVTLTTSPDKNRQAHDKDVSKSKTTWSGNKLVTRSTVRSLIGGHLLEFEIIDEWKLSTDGKTLTETSRTAFHDDLSGAIFVPGAEPEIKRVFNRVPD
jgi:hypothetical protein